MIQTRLLSLLTCAVLTAGMAASLQASESVADAVVDPQVPDLMAYAAIRNPDALIDKLVALVATTELDPVTREQLEGEIARGLGAEDLSSIDLSSPILACTYAPPAPFSPPTWRIVIPSSEPALWEGLAAKMQGQVEQHGALIVLTNDLKGGRTEPTLAFLNAIAADTGSWDERFGIDFGTINRVYNAFLANAGAMLGMAGPEVAKFMPVIQAMCISPESSLSIHWALRSTAKASGTVVRPVRSSKRSPRVSARSGS